MEEIVTILSTREWAITIWGTGFFIWMLTQSEIRKSLWNVIKILLGKNLRRFFLIIALYVAGITMIFYQLPFWNNIYLKAMQKVEFNPFEILFVEFPEAFGTESLEETFNVIDDCKTRYDDYFRWIEEQAIKAIYDLWDKKRKQNLYHTLKEWYDKQGKRSKMGLYDGRMTNFMSCLEGMDVYSDQDVASKVVKAVTDVYMENWNTGSLEEFVEALTSVKNEVESIRDDSVSGELELKFIGRNGETIKKLYSYADENTGSILRNVIEDTLDEYDDLSVNDRVSILLEMIEKIIK